MAKRVNSFQHGHMAEAFAERQSPHLMLNKIVHQ